MTSYIYSEYEGTEHNKNFFGSETMKQISSMIGSQYKGISSVKWYNSQINFWVCSS